MGEHTNYTPLPQAPQDGIFPGRISEAAALSISTYLSCITLIADDLSTIPFRAFEALPRGGRMLDDQSRVDWLLNKQPNPEMTPAVFRQLMIARTLGRGNGYAEIERDNAGRPIWAWPLENDRVTPVRNMGELLYRVYNFDDDDTYILPRDMLHYKGLGDGIAGYSVLEMASRVLSSSVNLDKYANETSDTKSQLKLGGVLMTKKKLNEEAQKRLRKDFQAEHIGKPGSVAVLEDEMTFTQYKYTSPHDVQLIQSRQYTAQEIARIFKIPPHKLGLLERSTNSNIEQQAIDYVVTCLMPWAIRFEQEVDTKLIGERAMARRFTKHNFSQLMRGDSKAVAELLDRMIRNGVFSINDARDYFDMNPIKNGDVFWVPAQWNTLERAVKGEPVSTGGGNSSNSPAPAPDAGGMMNDSSPQLKAIEQKLKKLSIKIVRREAHRFVQFMKPNRVDAGSKRTAWLNDFHADHGRYVERLLLPLIKECGVAEHQRTMLSKLLFGESWAKFTSSLSKVVLEDGELDRLPDAWQADRSDDLRLCLTKGMDIALRIQELTPTNNIGV